MEERAGERRPDLHGKKELKSTHPPSQTSNH